MTIELNHTIVPGNDPKASARFLAGILGLPVDPPVARFTPVTLGNRAHPGRLSGGAALAACLIRLVASPGW